MKKIVLLRSLVCLSVVLLILFSLAPISEACILSINPPNNSQVQTGDIQTFTLTRQVEHRRCPSSSDVIVLQLSRMQLVDEGSWVLSGRVATRVIKVQFSEPGEAVLKMISSCTLFPTRPVQIIFRVLPKEAETLPPPESKPPNQDESNPDPDPDPDLEQVPAPSVEPPPTPTTEEPPVSVPELILPLASTEDDRESSSEPLRESPDHDRRADYELALNGQNEAPQEDLNSSHDQSIRIELDPPPLLPISSRQFSFGRQEQSMVWYLLVIFLAVFFIRKKWYRWRLLFLIFSVGYFGFYAGGCLCPIGWLERFWFWFKNGAWSLTPALALVILLIITFLKVVFFVAGSVHKALFKIFFIVKACSGLFPIAWNATFNGAVGLFFSLYLSWCCFFPLDGFASTIPFGLSFSFMAPLCS
jgi:hypothetical protein